MFWWLWNLTKYYMESFGVFVTCVHYIFKNNFFFYYCRARKFLWRVLDLVFLLTITGINRNGTAYFDICQIFHCRNRCRPDYVFTVKNYIVQRFTGSLRFVQSPHFQGATEWSSQKMFRPLLSTPNHEEQM